MCAAAPPTRCAVRQPVTLFQPHEWFGPALFSLSLAVARQNMDGMTSIDQVLNFYRGKVFSWYLSLSFYRPSLKFCFNYLFDALKSWWNIMIDSWNWLRIGQCVGRTTIAAPYPDHYSANFCSKCTRWQRLYRVYFVERSGDAMFCCNRSKPFCSTLYISIIKMVVLFT